MKEEYDFSNGKRGAVVPPSPHQTRLTIHMDNDILDWLRSQVNAAGGGDYQELINQMLHDQIRLRSEGLETTLRYVGAR